MMSSRFNPSSTSKTLNFSLLQFNERSGSENLGLKDVINRCLDIQSNSFCIIGIYGLPGVGMTTIAKAIFNTLHNHFDGSAFLENVREHSKTNDGVLQLRETLYYEISAYQNLKVESKSRGINVRMEMFHRKKILVVLDDVEKLDEIDKLFENYDWFASGSRIVITTRDRHLLARYFSKRLACNVLQG